MQASKLSKFIRTCRKYFSERKFKEHFALFCFRAMAAKWNWSAEGKRGWHRWQWQYEEPYGEACAGDSKKDVQDVRDVTGYSDWNRNSKKYSDRYSGYWNKDDWRGTECEGTWKHDKYPSTEFENWSGNEDFKEAPDPEGAEGAEGKGTKETSTWCSPDPKDGSEFAVPKSLSTRPVRSLFAQALRQVHADDEKKTKAAAAMAGTAVATAAAEESSESSQSRLEALGSPKPRAPKTSHPDPEGSPSGSHYVKVSPLEISFLSQATGSDCSDLLLDGFQPEGDGAGMLLDDAVRRVKANLVGDIWYLGYEAPMQVTWKNRRAMLFTSASNWKLYVLQRAAVQRLPQESKVLVRVQDEESAEVSAELGKPSLSIRVKCPENHSDKDPKEILWTGKALWKSHCHALCFAFFQF